MLVYNWGEPQTNQYYEKITVLMYVCMYVCMHVAIRRPGAHQLIAHAHNYCGKGRQRWPCVNSK